MNMYCINAESEKRIFIDWYVSAFSKAMAIAVFCLEAKIESGRLSKLKVKVLHNDLKFTIWKS